MTKPLLIEIGVEELPAIPLLKILKNIEKSWKNILKFYRLSCDFQFLYTPRRLVLRHEGIPTKQDDTVLEFFGPPVNVAIRDGKVTKAGEGFARKCGTDFKNLERSFKNNREIFYYKRRKEGIFTPKLLQKMIGEWIGSMGFGKMMRWGERKEEFIRPIRWLQVRLGNDSVDIELFGVKSGKKTNLHRMVDFRPIEVVDIDRYDEILLKGKVILNPNLRRERILNQFDILEREQNVSIERDKNLLDEVVAITENPNSLLGSFDKNFLELPPEVIIASMKEHQRYFPVFKDGELSNRFVVVSNAVTDDYTKVILGNERVLKPRLADALFFYHNDLKRGLVTDGLEKIVFMDGLGSLMDKIEREKRISLKLLSIYREKVMEETGRDFKELSLLMEESLMLAKSDLTSEMIYEFTELQGLMGYYYAKALGKDELVYNAIKEQYLPIGENSELPSSIFSAIVAMAIKLDTLMGLFSVGKIPTGSKDPFALRRTVNGIVRIVVKYDLNFHIDEMVALFGELYIGYDTERLKEFIMERIKKSLDANPSVISAVLESGERDINILVKKVSALNRIVSNPSFKEYFSTFKRVANISKEVNLKQDLIINRSLFRLKEEEKLFSEYNSVLSKKYGNYEEQLKSMFALKSKLDDYFDNVMVNVEEREIRENRKNMIASIYKSFKEIADIKEISIYS